MSGFRADIQALRGVAILAVLVYHFTPGALPSGFLGVDLFFVLSGFLMAGLDTGGSALDFWKRRVRRIAPAYFVVIAATLAATFFIVLPHDFADASRSATASALLIPNVHFWSANAYFEKGLFRPLLHLWSLGVEAQFYLVLPLIAWVWRRSPWVVAVAAVATFAACLAALSISPKTPFFLTPFRLWEFLIGFAAAKACGGLGPSCAKWANPWLGVAGGAVIGLVLAVGVAPSEHPGFGALIVCAATAAVLVCGLPSRIIAIAAPLQVLGRYSYSLYLVHFPVLALMLYRPFGAADRSGTLLLGSLAITLALSAALYHLFEARRTPLAAPRWAAVTAIALTIGAFVLPGEKLRHYSPQDAAIFQAYSDRAPYRCGKIRRLIHPTAFSCEIAPTPAGGQTALLVGDSLADAIKMTIAEAAAAKGYGLRLNTENYAAGVGSARVDAILADAKANSASVIILHSAAESVRAGAIKQLVARGAAQGFRVVLLEPPPRYSRPVPELLYHRAAARPTLEAETARLGPVLDTLPSDPNLHRVSLLPVYCAPQCLVADSEGAPLLFDEVHLTLTGARLARAQLEQAFP